MSPGVSGMSPGSETPRPPRSVCSRSPPSPPRSGAAAAPVPPLSPVPLTPPWRHGGRSHAAREGQRAPMGSHLPAPRSQWRPGERPRDAARGLRRSPGGSARGDPSSPRFATPCPLLPRHCFTAPRLAPCPRASPRAGRARGRGRRGQWALRAAR